MNMISHVLQSEWSTPLGGLRKITFKGNVIIGHDEVDIVVCGGQETLVSLLSFHIHGTMRQTRSVVTLPLPALLLLFLIGVDIVLLL